MNRVLLVIAVLALGVAGAFLLLRHDDGGLPGSSGPDRPDVAPAPDHPATQRTAVQPADDPRLIPVLYAVVDARSRQPIAGCELRAARDGKTLATTDAAGRAAVPGREVFHLVFVHAGHLLGFFPIGTQAQDELEKAKAKLGRYEIALEPDRFTVPFALKFVTSAGAQAKGVRMRLRPLDEPPPSGGTVPRNYLSDTAPIEPALAQIWQQHAMVTALPAFRTLPHHFGIDSAATVYECDGEITLRCVATGPYLLDAQSEGELARLQVFVQVGQKQPLVVRLELASAISGIAVDASSGTPVAGVEIQIADAPLALAQVTSGADGTFGIGPLGRAPVTLLARKSGFDELTFGPVVPGDGQIRLELRAKPQREVRGRVRSRAGLKPIGGATVTARAGGEAEGKATTAADGTFVLQTALEDPEVVVRAADHQEWVEAITPGGQGLDFDLFPATPPARVAAGLSAMLSGRVLGPDGKPRSGVPVMVQSQQPPDFGGIAGRRILSGGQPAIEGMRLTDDEGRFTLECAQAGPAQLLVADGISTPEQARAVVIQLGAHVKDLELRAQR